MELTELIDRYRGGDRHAFAALVTRYQRPLFGYLGRMGLAQATAEELAQEAMLRAWSHRDDFDPVRARFSTWLFTIAHRLALNELDQNARRPSVRLDDGDAPDPPCQGKQPPEALDARQRRRQVQEALRQLPIGDRSALALAYFEELDLKTIARIEHCSVAAIKVRLHRAKARLRALLERHHG